MSKYRIIEVDYPRKGYFAEQRWLWMWWNIHMGARNSKSECERLIEIHKNLNYKKVIL